MREGLALLDIKTYYKTYIVKTVWYFHMKRQAFQWNRIESAEIHPSNM